MSEDSAVLGRLLSDHTVLNKGTEDELVGEYHNDPKF